MRQDLKSNEIKEISLVEIILASWKYKKTFFYIITIFYLFFFIVDYLIPKKSVYSVQLKNPININLDIYPSESTIASLILNNLASLDIQKINMQDEKIRLNYYNSYLIVQLLSSNNLVNFAKENDNKYNLKNYIIENKISVKKDREKFSFSLILPDNSINENFFKEYIIYTTSDTLQSFQNDVIKIEENKRDTLKKDLVQIYKILDNSKKENFYENNILIQNVSIIMALYEARMIRINENLLYFKNMKKEFQENWIVDGPNKYIANEKFYQIIKFVLPIILTFIVFLTYLLIKLTRLDK